MIAPPVADHFFHSTPWLVGRNLGIFFGVVFWLAVGFWTFKDARRRIHDPWLVATATILGLVPPFVGALIYMLFRPTEYLDDVRERELEIRAIEQRLRVREQVCPVCRSSVEISYLVCPVCTTRLRQACSSCKAPLEPLWQLCPFCETPVLGATGHVDEVWPLQAEDHGDATAESLAADRERDARR
jgi:hypothetical protein